MKIKTRDIGLLAVGFYIGAIVTVALTTATTQTLNTSPASSAVPKEPVLAAASRPPRPFGTNIQWEAPPVHILLPPRFIDNFDSQGPKVYPLQWRVDLIDTRYQPEIKLDDLK